MPLHRLFLAFLPPRRVAEEIDWCRACSGPCGAPVATGRLHLTLLMLGDYSAPPRTLVARTRDALSAARLPACRILLDTLVRGRHSMLLAPSEKLRGLETFQRSLAGALARSLIAPPRWWRFSPHVTLGYRPAEGAGGPIDPISWTGDELVLIHSLLGRTRHILLDRWRLGRD